MRNELVFPIAQPRYLTSDARPQFVWHHPPSPDRRRGAGIVLCPALGYEYMSAYRTWRILAERLAGLGFDVLRIDYDGTGNSSGDAMDPDRVGAWLRSIGCAIAEARRVSGSRHVALVGLRAGALLALQAAAADGDVERLVLWSPFQSGRAYVRELKALARLSAQGDTTADADETAVNAEGYLFAGETLATLAAWTKDAVTGRSAADVLLIERDDRPDDPALGDHLHASGSRVTRIRASGAADMLLPPHLASVPTGTVEAIEDWFREWQVSGAAAATQSGAEHDSPTAVAVHHGYRERAVRFGSGERLFGILAGPADGPATAPAIVLFNTGTGHHVGPHRLYVTLAREWAARGHAVLRFDLGGVGDSPPPRGAQTNVVYPEHMLEDAKHAIALVREEAPDRKVIVAGLCSGGWLAFQAARHGLAVDAFVSINAPLYLRDADVNWLREGRALERYQQSMRDPAKWFKALRGGVSYGAFARVAAKALVRRAAARARGTLREALPDGLAKDLSEIAGRGVKGLFVFSRGDNGLAYFQLHASPALRRASVTNVISQVVVEDVGHVFRPRAAQQTLSRLLADFVAQASQPPDRAGGDQSRLTWPGRERAGPSPAS